MQKRKCCITVIGLSGQSLFMGVNHFPSAGETVLSHQLHMEPGGKGFNQAIGCARLGAGTRFISAVGDDDAGRQCLNILKKELIDPNWMRIMDDKETALAVILTDQTGENQVTVYPGVSNSLTADDIYAAEAAFIDCDVVLAQLEMDMACLEAAVILAKRHQAKIILNPAPAQPLNADLLSKIDWLTPNYQEAFTLAGKTDQYLKSELPARPDLYRVSQSQSQVLRDLAGDILSPVMKLTNKRSQRPGLVITLGADGAYLFGTGDKYFLPFRQSLVKDTTGAGDTFSAAFATRIAMDWQPEDAVRFAMAAASLSVRTHGVMNAIPSESTVLDYLQNKPG